MEIFYAIPTKCAQRCNMAFDQWKNMGYKTAVLIDKGDPQPLDRLTDVVVVVDKYPGYYTAANLLCKHLTQADIIVTGGDDMEPDHAKMAQEIGAEFKDHFPDMVGIMQPTGDTLFGTDRICGSPWLGRGWIDNGYEGDGPFWPGYMAYYGDQEMLDIARMLELIWQRKDLCQLHHHYVRKDEHRWKPLPHHGRNHKMHWKNDKDLYYAREAEGFPTHGLLGT